MGGSNGQGQGGRDQCERARCTYCAGNAKGWVEKETTTNSEKGKTQRSPEDEHANSTKSDNEEREAAKEGGTRTAKLGGRQAGSGSKFGLFLNSLSLSFRSH